ncbi:MAG: hypothetical protein BWY15_00951 [Firmicutes bacterium ADurb.Bin193]|nr:MAG: hypothetical protein BWY15_00951 [Firmicutes bacterium ADurb.Bin193]
MNLKLIACKVLQRELSLLSAECPNFIDITYIRQGFHDEPDKFRKILQDEIDKIDCGSDIHSCNSKPFDAIVIGYGLCSNGTAGISSKRHTIVIPKAHDCITLILGSKERYREYFDAHSGGIYWYTPGWIENTLMPSKERYDNIYREYTEKYGEENADYLIQTEQDWMTKYSYCTYVNWKELQSQECIDYTKECAHFMKWNYDYLEGDSSLLHNMLNGKWDEKDFIVVPPGFCVEPSYDNEVLKVGKAIAQ